MLNDEDTLTKVDVNNDGGAKITIGSNLPYAKIQNEGGFIKATPYAPKVVGKNKDGTDKNTRSRYRMEAFFWAKYAETENEFWKVNAFKVRREGGVHIKATHYFDDAVAHFKANFENKIVDDIVKIMQNIKLDNMKGDEEIRVKKLLRNIAMKVPNIFLISLAENMQTDRGADFNNPETVTWVS